jgi:hypothetical protein
MNQLKFNHDAEGFHEALGSNVEDFATELAKCVKEFGDVEDKTLSKLAQTIHEKLSYEHILILATREVQNTIEQFNEKMLKDLLTEMTKKD